MSNPLNRLANRQLRSEIAAQKAANAKLHKELKRMRERANQLTVTLKTTKSRCGTLRKALREAEASKDGFALDVLHDSSLQQEVFDRVARNSVDETITSV